MRSNDSKETKVPHSGLSHRRRIGNKNRATQLWRQRVMSRTMVSNNEVMGRKTSRLRAMNTGRGRQDDLLKLTRSPFLRRLHSPFLTQTLLRLAHTKKKTPSHVLLKPPTARSSSLLSSPWATLASLGGVYNSAPEGVHSSAHLLPILPAPPR